MAILQICTYPEEILRHPAEPVTEIDEEVVKLVEHMAETMYSAPGIGLAATQVGVAKQVLVADIAARKPESELIVLINPEIVAAEGEVIFEEGCLSVPDYQAEVKRHEKIPVRGPLANLPEWHWRQVFSILSRSFNQSSWVRRITSISLTKSDRSPAFPSGFSTP